MKKQFQQRQYGYVSPKCKTVRLEQGFCFQGSYGDPGQAGGQGSVNDESTGEDY